MFSGKRETEKWVAAVLGTILKKIPNSQSPLSKFELVETD